MVGQARDLRVVAGCESQRSSRLVPALLHLTYWRRLLVTMSRMVVPGWRPVPGVNVRRAWVPSNPRKHEGGPTPVAGRGSPTGRLRAEIDQLFASDRELASIM